MGDAVRMPRKKHNLKDASGRYSNAPKCDACGKPCGSVDDFVSDDEVCGSGDGPGFYLCGRSRCTAKLEKLDKFEREQLYTNQRARNRS